MSVKKAISLGVGIGVLFIIVLIIYGVTNTFNHTKSEDHLVKGVDLSAYQGDVDWALLADQNIDFAFIKATEGDDYVDTKFKTNWEESQKTQLKVGAYHFLNYDTTGKAQAKNFIDNVPVSARNLPPVVDLELYGIYEDNALPKEQVKVILDELLKELEDNYGVKPIIYTTHRIFKMYIGTDYKDYPIWIVDLDNYWPDALENGEIFTFWQYSHRGMMDGYDGDETFIDMNLYNGTYAEFIDEFF
ncbi:glycoside hydrolase family 25 protein [Acetobacterium sp.]|uniref:glycoside hydrolase family 25 protein n=1 Tax=Acetobacterium sp. TaxID=1872094 RepID=UPI0035941D4A